MLIKKSDSITEGTAPKEVYITQIQWHLSKFPWKFYDLPNPNIPPVPIKGAGKITPEIMEKIKYGLSLIKKVAGALGFERIIDNVIELFNKGEYYYAEYTLFAALSQIRYSVGLQSKTTKPTSFKERLEEINQNKYPPYFPSLKFSQLIPGKYAYTNLKNFINQKKVGTTTLDPRKAYVASKYIGKHQFSPAAIKGKVKHEMTSGTTPHGKAKHSHDIFIPSPGFEKPKGLIVPTGTGPDTIYKDPYNAEIEAAESGPKFFDEQDRSLYWEYDAAFKSFVKDVIRLHPELFNKKSSNIDELLKLANIFYKII